jgi:hypothetical protein
VAETLVTGTFWPAIITDVSRAAQPSPVWTSVTIAGALRGMTMPLPASTDCVTDARYSRPADPDEESIGSKSLT